MQPPVPDSGRRFSAVRSVQLGDADTAGRLRLDALAAYLQDVAAADARDAGLDEALSWVVRRLVIHVPDPPACLPRLGEGVELTTWCSGWGSRWAERSTSVRSPTGRAEAVATWVAVDRAGRPATLTEQFHRVYDEAAGGRRVSARLSLAEPPAGIAWDAWHLRRTDLDVLGHVNNAAYFHAVEEVRAGRPVSEVTIEYRQPLLWGQPVEIARAGSDLWLRQGGRVGATARLVTRGEAVAGGC